MQWLQSYAVVLVLVALIAAVSEMLLQSTPYQKYVKVIVGIVLILAVIGPVFGLMGQEVSLDGYRMGAQTTEDFKRQYQNTVTKAMREKLEQTAGEALGRAGIALEKIEIDLDAAEDGSSLIIRSVTLQVDSGGDRAADIVAQSFGIAAGQVNVRN